LIKRVVLISFLLVVTSTVFPQSQRIQRSGDLSSFLNGGRPANDFNNWTTASEFGVTITNFGILGEGWTNPEQPSALYQQYATQGKKQVSHFSYAGLWIGGQVGNEERVSTAIVDGVFDYGEQGFEFKPRGNPGDSISIKSSIRTDRYFSPDAVSHQDFVSEFDDVSTEGLGDTHTPLGIRVHMETYNWNYSFANSFVILNYTVTNVSDEVPGGGDGWTIKSPYVGIWMDCSVANMNYTSIYEPGGGFTWYDNLDGFDTAPDENGYPLDLAYQYDADGDNGWAESYIGMKVLGSDVPKDSWDSYYRQWVWTTASNMDYPDYRMPQDDVARYQLMQANVQPSDDAATSTDYYDNGNTNYRYFPSEPNSWIMMLSGGPFGSKKVQSETGTDSLWVLEPGESVNVVFTVVAGFWNGRGMNDTPKRRANLQNNAGWALKAYNGEDTNGNGVLDPGEDAIRPNNKIDRYILPAPPPSPRLTVVPGDQQVTLYWDDAPLHARDPVSRERDFEGFRIYGARKTQGGTESFSLLREYDLDNGIGYDTGLEDVRIYDEFGNPSDTTINGRKYQFKWTNTNLKNGWTDKNLYSVTSYDRGDERLNLESLESSVNENRVYAVPGIRPTAADNRTGVYPNPYRAHAEWDGFSERERVIWFMYLPERCTIRIYTMSGDLVDVIDHNAATYSGGDIEGIQTGTNSKFSGGEHAWDLISRDNQAIASGMYIYTVENKETGHTKTGKFLVIK